MQTSNNQLTTSSARAGLDPLQGLRSKQDPSSKQFETSKQQYIAECKRLLSGLKRGTSQTSKEEKSSSIREEISATTKTQAEQVQQKGLSEEKLKELEAEMEGFEEMFNQMKESLIQDATNTSFKEIN